MPLEREGRKALADLVKQLDGKGISEVWSSDLDEDAARFVAEQLKVPLRKDFQLRRFNFGRHHATPLSKAETILSELIAKWESNPTVPIRGGDSLTSLTKRLGKSFGKLIEKENAVFITDEQTARYLRDRSPKSLIRNGNRLDLNKIYVLRKT
jgi:broad specificity phosphatase PhoE